MAQPSDGNMDLFTCAKENGNEWELVEPDNADTPVPAAPETEAVVPAGTNEAPQIWDDIPREPVPPVVDEPATLPPVVTEPTVEEPVVNESVVEEPITEEPVADEPAAISPGVNEPVADAPVPAAVETAAVPPVAEKPAAMEPPVSEPGTVLPPAPVSEDAADAAPVYRHVAPEGISSLKEMGHYLKEIRLAEKMPADQVCDATKIRPDYLDALEAGDASELPQAIYVLAYIRKLCDVYSVDTSRLDDFFNDLRDGFSYELPENINKSIVGHESDDEQQKKVRRLAIALISAASFLALVIVAGIVLLCVGIARSGFFKSSAALGESEIVALQGKPLLQLYVIHARTR